MANTSRQNNCNCCLQTSYGKPTPKKSQTPPKTPQLKCIWAKLGCYCLGLGVGVNKGNNRRWRTIKSSKALVICWNQVSAPILPREHQARHGLTSDLSLEQKRWDGVGLSCGRSGAAALGLAGSTYGAWYGTWYVSPAHSGLQLSSKTPVFYQWPPSCRQQQPSSLQLALEKPVFCQWPPSGPPAVTSWYTGSGCHLQQPSGIQLASETKVFCHWPPSGPPSCHRQQPAEPHVGTHA